MAAATGVRLKKLLGRVMPDRLSQATDDPSRRVSVAGSTASTLGRYGSDMGLSGQLSSPGALTPPGQLSQAPSGTAQLPVQSPSAAAAAAETETPRPFLARVTSSFRRQSSAGDRKPAAAALGSLGMLVAEDESRRSAAGALPPVEQQTGQLLAASTAGAAGAAPSGDSQPADAVVQVGCSGNVRWV